VFLAISCFWALSTPPAAAHGPIDEQIAALTSRIREDPRNATLYLARGELHRHHREWDAALADFDRSAQLAPTLAEVDLARGRTLLDADRPGPAKVALDRFLGKHPEHVEALLARARVLVVMDQNRAAVDDYTRAIALEAQRGRNIPDHYLERARACAAQGAEFIAEAVRGLDEGIAALGPIVTLELYAIELELTGKSYDAALARLEIIRAQSRREERWLVRRGEILEHAGHPAEARLAYAQALATIESLPERHRKTRATTQLEAQIRAALTRLAAAEH
jgi:tetratricopeptide (TPR) repeat protein